MTHDNEPGNDGIDLDATIPAIPPVPATMRLWDVLHNRKYAAAGIYVGLLGLIEEPSLPDWVGARAHATGHADAFQLLRKEWLRRVSDRGELLSMVSQQLAEQSDEDKRHLLAVVRRVIDQVGADSLPAFCFYTHVRAILGGLPKALPVGPLQSAQDVDALFSITAAVADCRNPSDAALQAARQAAASELGSQILALRPVRPASLDEFDQLLARLALRPEAERKRVLRSAVLLNASLEGAVWKPEEQSDSRLPAISPPSAEFLHAVHAALGLPLRYRPAGWPRRT